MDDQSMKEAAKKKKHDRKKHFARCNYCGWYGRESELPDDPEGHPCGKDQCPECRMEYYIECCFKTEAAAIRGRSKER
jgi:hypothetical protein